MVKRIPKKPIFLFLTGFFFFIVSFIGTTQLLLKESDVVVVPSVEGLTFAQAKKTLAQKDLQAEIQAYDEHSQALPNTVLIQNLEPGTIVKQNRTIMLVVAKEAEISSIPWVVGKHLVDAQKLIRKEGFLQPVISETCHAQIKDGDIISQRPWPDELNQKAMVRLLVSTGPCEQEFMLLNLVGKKFEARIKNEFTDKSIEIKTIAEKKKSKHLPLIKAQDRAARSFIRSGELLTLQLE